MLGSGWYSTIIQGFKTVFLLVYGGAFMARILLVMCVFAECVSGSSFSWILPVDQPWTSFPLDVCQLAGGSFALTHAAVMEDAVLFLMDADGEPTFKQANLRVPGRALESGGWVLPVADGGCFVCTYSEPRATGINSDIALFRLSESGEVAWKAMTGINTDTVYLGIGAAASDNGGCAVLGTCDYGYENAFLRMYSSSGSEVWEIDFKEVENYYPFAVYSTGEGFLVLLGHEWEETAMVLRVSADGIVEWSAEIPCNCGSGPSAFAECSTGYRVYLSLSDNTGAGVFLLLGTDGEILEMAQFSHGVSACDALITDDGSIVLAGSRNMDGEEGAVIEAFDFQGEPLWGRRMDSSGEDCFTAVCGCSDGGYGILGSINPMNENDPCGIVFVKTGPEGIVEDSADPAFIPVPVDTIREPEAPTFCIGWVIACGVYEAAEEAFDRSAIIYDEIETGIPGALWIPDWGSLSGYEGWLSYISFTQVDRLSDEQVAQVLAVCPDSYMVWVGMTPVSDVRMSLTDFNLFIFGQL